jgi:hypothetical protein
MRRARVFHRAAATAGGAPPGGSRTGAAGPRGEAGSSIGGGTPRGSSGVGGNGVGGNGVGGRGSSSGKAELVGRNGGIGQVTCRDDCAGARLACTARPQRAASHPGIVNDHSLIRQHPGSTERLAHASRALAAPDVRPEAPA